MWQRSRPHQHNQFSSQQPSSSAAAPSPCIEVRGVHHHPHHQQEQQLAIIELHQRPGTSSSLRKQPPKVITPRRCAPCPQIYFPPPPKYLPEMSRDGGGSAAAAAVASTSTAYPNIAPAGGGGGGGIMAVAAAAGEMQYDPAWRGHEYAYTYHHQPNLHHQQLEQQEAGGRDGGVGFVGPYREGSYRTRHTYLTRYGTEENIYEEITDLSKSRYRIHNTSNYKNQHNHRHQDSIMSLNQSLMEEEVRRVQSGHRRVLGELNLSVEAMLMPSSSREGSDDNNTDRENETEDQLSDLMTVGPTDELLSPVGLAELDSGFSGSSSSASYRSVAGSLRRGPERPKSAGAKTTTTTMSASSPSPGGHSKSFWGKKAWKKLSTFSSNISLNKSKDENRLRSGNWEEQSNEHRVAVTPHHHSHPQQVQSRTTTLQYNVSQRSSEDSWCSGSEPDISSDEESDKSVASANRNNGQLLNTINRARTLWRGGNNNGTASNQQNNRLSLDSSLPPGDLSPQNQGRLSRWFSIRRNSNHQYDLENADAAQRGMVGSSALQCSNKMPQLPEVEEEMGYHFPSCTSSQRRQLPPSLPPPPPNLTPQQIKRRMIVAAIVHSENSYIATLQRLVNDYKKPLEENSPAILSGSKIQTLFYRLPEILQCHTLFRIALAEYVMNWDTEERIGDVFVASFSKAIVLDIYSGFINNFSVAMDLAKMEAKRKSALADFFKVKQISSMDRLSFFGLMVKPVQRFPQFILFLQDLLKHTPQGHHDRMSLQLALTQLESLAEMLNERKREAEQYQAFKEMLRNISGKFSARPLSDSNRYLLREDNVTQLEYTQNGLIAKAKSRRLLLLNDLVVCVSVASKSSDDFGTGERLSLKWTQHVSDVEIEDTSASPTLSRILTSNSKGGSIKSNGSFDGTPPQEANNLCGEMSNLMHDYEIMSRVSSLTAQLKGKYKDINLENARKILHQIQISIQQKDEEMAWVDSCCLQLNVKTKGKEETYTFQTNNPSIKKEWITELRLAQLALDPNNSPAWEIPEQEQRPSTKMPLFVRSQMVYKSQHQTEVRCGCYYTVTLPKSSTKRRNRHQNYLWISTSDGVSSHISVLSQHNQHNGILKDVTSFTMAETQVTAMEAVKGIGGIGNMPCPSMAADTVWIGTDRHKLHLFTGDEPEKQEELAQIVVADAVMHIRYHCGNVFVALANGTLCVYRRNPIDGSWIINEAPQTLTLGTDPIAYILPMDQCLYAACGRQVWVIDATTAINQKSFVIQHEHSGNVHLMAHSGIGLWISQKHSSTICLYHTETFKHLQDINVASIVARGCSRDSMNNNTNSRAQVHVTSLLACKGLLWVGTNVGRVLTIPLPRLEGVPIISGRANISYHAHFGPISFLLALQPRTYNNVATKGSIEDEVVQQNGVSIEGATTINENKDDNMKPKRDSQLSDCSSQSVDTKLKYPTNSPVVLRRRRSKDSNRVSKTLPRGLGTGGSIFSTSSTSSQGSGNTNNVYGLYSELMYIKDYDKEENILTDNVYESLRRSDPQLAAIPNKVSTLDRRLRMKVSRPRSLDLSNWSVDSRSSSISTSSEESMMALRLNLGGKSVSRNNSNASSSRQLLTTENEGGLMKQQPFVGNVAGKPTCSTPATASKATNKTSSSNSNSKAQQSIVDNPRKTVITLMGGRGYVNYKQPCCFADKSTKLTNNGGSGSIKDTNTTTNCNDAHIVIWELKL